MTGFEQKTDQGNLVLDGTKLPWHLDRVKKWYNGEKIAPITIEWALTPKCTYDCVFCSYDRDIRMGKIKKPEFTKQAAFNFLKDAAEAGVKAVSLASDGESTCNPILYDVVPYAKKVGLDIAMSTNGYLLDDERLHEILPHFTYLRFNVPGADPKHYTKITKVSEKCFHKVCNTIKKCSELKKDSNLDVTLGLQFVSFPEDQNQIIPFAQLGKKLGVDYTVIKHCSDVSEGDSKNLGIDYAKYKLLTDVLKKAESYSDKQYLVKAKWSKILSKGNRRYTHCYGPAFMFQISGSGTLGFCGKFYQDRYKQFQAGNVITQRFKDIFNGERYWKILNHFASNEFSNSICWPLCLQHKVNEFLWDLKQGNLTFEEIEKYKEGKEPPQHTNFI